MNWKDFLYFQRGEQVAITLLSVLILFGILLNVTLCSRNSSDVTLLNSDSVTAQFDEFRTSLQEREQPQEIPVAERDDSQRPVQRTAQPQRTTTTTNRSESRSAVQRTTFPRAPRLADGETISLNDSDTIQWMKIPGIGSTFANRIVRYQTRLGGFSSIYQLLEVNGISDELFARIAPYISHNDSTIQKLHVNQLEFRELLAHPYLEFEQVQVIMNLRRRTGRISTINELAMLSEFSENDIERLLPYLAF